MKNIKNEQQIVKSADRVLDIFEFLVDSGNNQTLSEISKKLRMPVSSVYALIQTLLKRKYIEKNHDSKSYKLGIKLLEIGSMYLSKLETAEVAKPTIRELRDICDETVNIAIRDDVDIIYIAKEESSKSMRLISYVGKRLPAHATALGKVLLSSLSNKEIDKLYKGRTLSKLTSSTITNLNRLKAELEFVRKNGYSYDNEESTEGLQCFASPILNFENQIVASLSISIPIVRLNKIESKKFITLVKDYAKKISINLGNKK